MKLSPLKVVMVAYWRWSFTRGGNHRANLTENFAVLVICNCLSEVVAHRGLTQFASQQSSFFVLLPF